MLIPVELIDKITAYVVDAVKNGTPIAKAMSEAWIKFRVPNAMLAATAAISQRAIYKELGMSTVRAAGGIEAAYRKLLKDQDVKAQIRAASARARRDLEKEVRTAIKTGESSKAFADRLVKNPEDAKFKDVRKEIRNLKNGISDKEFNALAKQFSKLKTASLRGNYEQALKAAQKGVDGAVEKQMKYAMQAKARYNMERVARTERERAIAAANVEKLASDPDVKLVKFVLSVGHQADVCDSYARADMGFGAGIYTLEAAPLLPIHPNGRSRLIPVYVPPKGKSQTKTAEEALKGSGVESPNLTPIKRKL